MKKAGYHQIRFGIESFSESTGKVIHKKVNYDKNTFLFRYSKIFLHITEGFKRILPEFFIGESDDYPKFK